MKKIIRKVLFWLLKDKVRAYCISQIISDIDLVQSNGDITEYVKLEMAHKIGRELLKDGAIEIEIDDWKQFNGTRYIMRVYCVNFNRPEKNNPQKT